MITVTESVRRMNSWILPAPTQNPFLEVVNDHFPRKSKDHGWLYTLHYVAKGEDPVEANIIKNGSFRKGVADRVRLYVNAVNRRDSGVDSRLRAAIYDALKTRRKHYLWLVPYDHVPLSDLLAAEKEMRADLRRLGIKA